MVTPIRKAIQASSPLQQKIEDGMGALDGSHRQYVDAAIRSRIKDSLETDENLRLGQESSNRWDYLLGDGKRNKVVGLEPHGATEKEIKVVVAKREAALLQLRAHLRAGQQIAAWFWVQSSGSGFLDTSRARRAANSRGIIFVGRKLMARDLDAL